MDNSCGFCGRRAQEVLMLIANDQKDTFICNECFVLCLELMAEKLTDNLKLEKSQKAKLKTVKETRDKDRVQSALSNLKVVAESQKNVMPPILEAVKTKATLGEITSVLKGVYGTHTENVHF